MNNEKVDSMDVAAAIARVAMEASAECHEINITSLGHALEAWIEGKMKQSEAAESKLSQLQLAVRNVYFAGVWSCSRPVDEVKLWTELRDAAGFKPGESTAMNGGGQ